MPQPTNHSHPAKCLLWNLALFHASYILELALSPPFSQKHLLPLGERDPGVERHAAPVWTVVSVVPPPQIQEIWNRKVLCEIHQHMDQQGLLAAHSG